MPVTSRNIPAIKEGHDFEGTTCTKCGRIDIAEQASDYAF